MVTRLHRMRSFATGEEGTDRHAVSQSLRHRQDIRLHAVGLPCKHGAGAAHATLDLIEDQQQIMLIAELPYAPEKFLRRRIDTALTLDRLHDDRTGVFIDLRLYGIEIVEGCEAHTPDQRLKRCTVVVLAGHADRAHRTTVEGALHRDDLAAGPALIIVVATRDLQRALDGLRTGVREEHTVHPARRKQLLRRLDGRLIVEEIRRVQQSPVDLLLHRLVHQRVSIAEPRHRDARTEIEVRMSARIVELDALRVIKRYRKAIVGLVQYLLALRYEAVIHDISLYDGIIHKFHFFHPSSVYPPHISANALSQHPPEKSTPPFAHPANAPSQHPPARALPPRCAAPLP